MASQCVSVMDCTVDVLRLPSEIIQDIAMFLSLPDVCNCKLVCKQWKELLSSDHFCKRYVLKKWNFTLESKPKGYLQYWQSPDDWYCYWSDEDNEKVFTEPPKQWKNGIIHPADLVLQDDKEIKYSNFLQAVHILEKLLKAGEDFNLDCGAWGNEGSSNIEVCIFPWNKEHLPKAKDVVDIFHFNPIFHQYIMEQFFKKKLEIRQGDEDGSDKSDHEEENDSDKQEQQAGDDNEQPEREGSENDNENDLDEEGSNNDEGEDEDKEDDQEGEDEDNENEPEGEDDDNEDDQMGEDEDNEDDQEGEDEDNEDDPEAEDEDNEDDPEAEADDNNGNISWACISCWHGDIAKARLFFEWMRQTFLPFRRICLGCDAMNPTPFFMLTQLSPGWVGGVITGLSLT